MNRLATYGLAAALALAILGTIFLPATEAELTIGAEVLAEGQRTERERAEELRLAALLAQHKAAK